jgi:hypothetical protein
MSTGAVTTATSVMSRVAANPWRSPSPAHVARCPSGSAVRYTPTRMTGRWPASGWTLAVTEEPGGA